MKWMHLPLVIAAALLFAPKAAAQQVSLKPENRLAVVNIGVVFTHYEKAKGFKSEMEKTLKPYKDKADVLKAKIAKWQAAVTSPNIDPADKTKMEQNLIEGKRKLEDLDREARSNIGKKQEENLIRLYKDVSGAVKEYADAHGILVVLAFGEPPDGDVFAFANINRKLTGMDAGGTVPLYLHASADISQQVTDLLNRATLKRPAAPTPRADNQRDARRVRDRARETASAPMEK